MQLEDDTTSQSELRPRAGLSDALVLRVVASPDGDAVGRIVPLRDGLVMGRGSDAGLRLQESRVSRHHAQVHVAASGQLARLSDQGSKNGLRVNGVPRQAHALFEGDVVRVGDSLLVVDSYPPGLPSQVPQSPPGQCVAVGSRSYAAWLEAMRAASTDISVLLQGPSGTGKEVYSTAIHQASGRTGPFHAVNCGAIPRELMEASLFGHRKGAFTGAVDDQKGHVRSAQGGTLFLDEVGELSPAGQVALLRVLEERQVTPVGATRSEAVDIRVVTATHKDLRAAVAAGEFRDDLYARIAEWVITIPALKDRRADIPHLVSRFVGAGVSVHADALEALLVGHWPHHVRGLRAALRQAEIRATTSGNRPSVPVVVRVEHLPQELAAPQDKPAALAPAPPAGPFERPERQELLATLEHYTWRIHLVAKHYGKDRRQVYRWMSYAGIDVPKPAASGRQR